LNDGISRIRQLLKLIVISNYQELKAGISSSKKNNINESKYLY